MTYQRITKVQINGVSTSPEVDASALDAIATSAKTGGRISGAEMQKSILPRFDDYAGYVGAAERPLVRALEAAAEGKDVRLDNRSIRLTGPAKSVLEAWVAAKTGVSPIAELPAASFDAAVSKALREWYAKEVERVIADFEANDPESAADYDATERAADLERAADAGMFLRVEGAPFSFRNDENLAWLHLGEQADDAYPMTNAKGEPVPREAISFIELNYDPHYAGQQLTSWFAFDKRNGELLRFFETQA